MSLLKDPYHGILIVLTEILDIVHILSLEDPQHSRGLICLSVQVERQKQGRYSCGLIRKSWSQSLGIVGF